MADTTSTPADDRTDESAEMVVDAPDADPADMSGLGAEETAEKMHGESDAIAEDADVDAPGHGAKGSPEAS